MLWAEVALTALPWKQQPSSYHFTIYLRYKKRAVMNIHAPLSYSSSSSSSTSSELFSIYMWFKMMGICGGINAGWWKGNKSGSAALRQNAVYKDTCWPVERPGLLILLCCKIICYFDVKDKRSKNKLSTTLIVITSHTLFSNLCKIDILTMNNIQKITF